MVLLQVLPDYMAEVLLLVFSFVILFYANYKLFIDLSFRNATKSYYESFTFQLWALVFLTFLEFVYLAVANYYNLEDTLIGSVASILVTLINVVITVAFLKRLSLREKMFDPPFPEAKYLKESDAT